MSTTAFETVVGTAKSPAMADVKLVVACDPNTLVWEDEKGEKFFSLEELMEANFDGLVGDDKRRIEENDAWAHFSLEMDAEDWPGPEYVDVLVVSRPVEGEPVEHLVPVS